MSTLKTSDLEDMTGLSQRYWQRRIAAGEVPGATQLNLGANRRFLIEREAFTTWWEGKPSEAGPVLKRRPVALTPTERTAAKGVSVVYLIRAGTHVKIGFTSHLQKRVSEIQTGNPLPCTVEAVMPGCRSQEEDLHRHLGELGFKSRGEWYSWSSDIHQAALAFMGVGK